MGPHVGERALAQVRRGGRPDQVAQQRCGAGQPAELLGAGIAAGQVPDDGSGQRRVAGHQPFEPVRLGGRQLDLLENVVVVHRSPYQRSGPASSAGARYLVNSGPTPLPSTSRR